MRNGLILLVCFFCAAVVHAQEAPKPAEPPKDISHSPLLKQQPLDIVIGKHDAPITIIEYASLSCIHCAHFYNEAFPPLKEKYIDTGKARLLYRDFPLNEAAVRAAQLVHCAPASRREGFLKTLFGTQSKWAYEKDFRDKLKLIARIGGFTEDSFNQCLADKKLEDSIVATRMEGGKQLGVAGTPSFFVGGKKSDSRTFEQFDHELGAMVAGK